MLIASPSRMIGSFVSLDAEYTIYAYSHFHEENLGSNRWHRVTTSHDPEEAIKKAEQLFFSNQYQKIEIKKKTYNDKKGQHIVLTYRIFEKKPKSNYLMLGAILLLALSSVGLLYLAHI